jgi:hypothetical protein
MHDIIFGGCCGWRRKRARLRDCDIQMLPRRSEYGRAHTHISLIWHSLLSRPCHLQSGSLTSSDMDAADWPLWEWPLSDVSPYNRPVFRKSVIPTGWWNRPTGSFFHSLLKLRRHTPTVDSMVDMFTLAILRASEQSIPRSSSKPRRVPVPWWTEECRDAIRARKRALWIFGRHPREENPINLSSSGSERVKLFENANGTRVSSSSPQWPVVHLQLLYGNIYDVYQSDVSTLLSRSFLWTASQQLHRMKWLTHYRPTLKPAQARQTMPLRSFQPKRVKKAAT